MFHTVYHLLNKLWDVSSAGRAIALQAIGQGFKSLTFHSCIIRLVGMASAFQAEIRRVRTPYGALEYAFYIDIFKISSLKLRKAISNINMQSHCALVHLSHEK